MMSGDEFYPDDVTSGLEDIKPGVRCGCPECDCGHVVIRTGSTCQACRANQHWFGSTLPEWQRRARQHHLPPQVDQR